MVVDAAAVFLRSSQYLHSSLLAGALRVLRLRFHYTVTVVSRRPVKRTAPPSLTSAPFLSLRNQRLPPPFLPTDVGIPHGSSTSSTSSSGSAARFGGFRPTQVLLARRRAPSRDTRPKSREASPRQLASTSKSATSEICEDLNFCRCILQAAEATPSSSCITAEAPRALDTEGTSSSASLMKASFYAVAIGKQRGIYSTWDQCSEQVKGFSGAIYKSFRTLAEARAFLDAHPAPSSSHDDNGGEASASVIETPRSEPPVKPQRLRGVCEEAAASPPSTRRARIETAMPRSTYEGDSPLSSSHHQVVYVDGACSHNGTPRARAGYGGYFGSSHDARNFALPVPATEAQTNNRGEMRAVIHCIVQGFVDAGAPKEALDVSHCVTPDWRVSELARPLRRLVIHTDSRYVIDGLTRYSVKWMANGFKLATKEPVLNQDLWKQLIRLRDAYNTCYAQQQHAIESSHPYAFTRESLTSPPKRFHTHNTCNDETEGIELRHVKGHSKDYGNEMADMLAVRGSRMHDSWR